MNRRALEEGRRLRAQIAAIVDTFRPGQRYTWKDVNRRLDRPRSKARVLAHLRVVLQERAIAVKARPGLVFDSPASSQTQPMKGADPKPPVEPGRRAPTRPCPPAFDEHQWHSRSIAELLGRGRPARDLLPRIERIGRDPNDPLADYKEIPGAQRRFIEPDY